MAAQLGETRALVLGAETAAGLAIAAALGAAGSRVAVVAAGPDPDVAFAVQRLARRLGAAASQAIDATNEMAVRVMTRQISKALGGLDLLIFCADLGDNAAHSLALASRFAAREMARSGGRARLGGTIVVALPEARAVDVARLAGEHAPQAVPVLALDVPPAPDEAWARDALARLLPARGEPPGP